MSVQNFCCTIVTMSKSYWDRVHENKYSQADWSQKPSIFATQAVQYFPESGTLLEIGTGQGGDADFFQLQGYKVTATDYSENAVVSASKRVKNVDFQIIDTAQGLPFSDYSFDIVYSHLALHYFDAETTKKVFADIHRILKPEGIFATLTNTIEDPEIKEYSYEKLEDGFYRDPKGIEKRYFSMETISAFTNGLFQPLLVDNEGATYKDEIATLIRFIGKKI